MVKLTEYEQRMLDGEMGPFKQKALEKIVKYANALGAEELCTVTKATVYMGFHPYLESVKSEDYDEVFSKMVLCETTDKVYHVDQFSDECFAQTCVGPCDHDCYAECGISKEVFDKNHKFLDIVRDAGVSIAGSCTPYLSGWIPLMGEHFVSTESSNILFSNSVFGAYGNADGLEASSWAAICGRTPKWGNHIKENRYATHIIDVQCKCDTRMEWDVVGHAMGRLLTDTNARPVIIGNYSRPDMIKLKKFFSTLCTTSPCEICHIVGITPEAPTLEAALGGHEPKKRLVLTQEDYDRSLAELCSKEEADVQQIVMGCPHYSLEEIKDVAYMLKGKKVADTVNLQIWCDMTMQRLAEVSGYAKWIEDSGAHLLNSSCPVVAARTSYDFATTGFATDGAKQAHYSISTLTPRNVKVFYGDMEQCINAAITGRWENK